jgi:hypothetical protein
MPAHVASVDTMRSAFPDLSRSSEHIAPDVDGCRSAEDPVRRRSAVRPRWARAGLYALGPAAFALLALTAAASTNVATRAPAPVSSAKLSHSRLLPYPLPHVWPTSIRYLRVDRGYAIVDSDLDAGYILFDFPAGQNAARGSAELFATEDSSGRPSVQIKVSTDGGPVHLPHAIVDGLAQKLRAERGQPAPPPPPPETPPHEDPFDDPSEEDKGLLR